MHTKEAIFKAVLAIYEEALNDAGNVAHKFNEQGGSCTSHLASRLENLEFWEERLEKAKKRTGRE